MDGFISPRAFLKRPPNPCVWRRIVALLELIFSSSVRTTVKHVSSWSHPSLVVYARGKQSFHTCSLYISNFRVSFHPRSCGAQRLKVRDLSRGAVTPRSERLEARRCGGRPWARELRWRLHIGPPNFRWLFSRLFWAWARCALDLHPRVFRLCGFHGGRI